MRSILGQPEKEAHAETGTRDSENWQTADFLGRRLGLNKIKVKSNKQKLINLELLRLTISSLFLVAIVMQRP